MQNKMVCKQNLKCMHDRRTIRTALAAFKGNIYQKYNVPELSYPTPKNIYKFMRAN
jgi:hypothetical protein